MCDLVLVGTVGAQWAVAFAESFAVGAARVETEAVLAAKEVFEGEVVAVEGGGREVGLWGC